MRHAPLLALLLFLTACSSASECSKASTTTVGDPFDACDPIKPINEGVFQFNLIADEYVIAPAAHAYHHIPPEGRVAIDNFLTNLAEPANVLNSALQGDVQAAGTSLWRFILNSTFGFAGLRDFAGENGLKYNEQNFNKTLASYGLNDGPYIVLPIFGPSSVRDATGKVVDWFTDPVGWYLSTPESIAEDVTDGINTREQQDAVVQQFYYDALDPYAASRAGFLQHQAFR